MEKCAVMRTAFRILIRFFNVFVGLVYFIKMEFSKLFLERYEAKEMLGSGSFGKVYKLQHIQKDKAFAIKIDIKQKGNVFLEAQVLSDLQGGVGIPKLYKFGTTEKYSYMVMELLFSTLSDLLQKANGRFKLATVISIILQLLTRVQYIHSKGYLHRDIKSQQILTGKNARILYLTDYGLSRKFEANNYHIAYQGSCPRVGNATFASINSHSGIRQSRRDDLESLAYLAIYLLKGSLPWQRGPKKVSSNLKWQHCFQVKNGMTIEETCANCPNEFAVYLKYCRNLKFEDKPDYAYAKKIFVDLQENNGLVEGFLEWSDGEVGQRKSVFLTVPGNNEKSSSKDQSFTRESGEFLQSATYKDIVIEEKKKNIKKSRNKNRANTCISDIKVLKVNAEKEALKIPDLNLIRYNSLDATPKNILPEMHNREITFSSHPEVKKSENCIIY